MALGRDALDERSCAGAQGDRERGEDAGLRPEVRGERGREVGVPQGDEGEEFYLEVPRWGRGSAAGTEGEEGGVVGVDEGDGEEGEEEGEEEEGRGEREGGWVVHGGWGC